MVDVLSGRYWPSSDIRLRVVKGEAILLDLASEEIFRLNETGTRIWQLLVEHHDPAAVLQDLQDEFDVGPQILRDDLEDLLEQLLEAGLITDHEDLGPD